MSFTPLTLGLSEPHDVGMATFTETRMAKRHGKGNRRDLARSWLGVVDRARHPTTGLSARVPICSDRVVAAQAEIADLVNLLTADSSNSARVAQIAEALLIDGTGPLYNRRSQSDLAQRIRQALQAAA
jgi:hypothetical protein